MGPDFTVQYTDITMLETSQTADFKALANSLLELVTRLEIVMKAIFSKENFMAMEPISMQMVTNLWVDLGKDKLQEWTGHSTLISENLEYLEIIFIRSRGWKGKIKSYLLDYEKKTELSCKNNVFYTISQLFKSKRRGL